MENKYRFQRYYFLLFSIPFSMISFHNFIFFAGYSSSKFIRVRRKETEAFKFFNTIFYEPIIITILRMCKVKIDQFPRCKKALLTFIKCKFNKDTNIHRNCLNCCKFESSIFWEGWDNMQVPKVLRIRSFGYSIRHALAAVP